MSWTLVFPERLYERLWTHLFPGDDEEHGAQREPEVDDQRQGAPRLLDRQHQAGEDYEPDRDRGRDPQGQQPQPELEHEPEPFEPKRPGAPQPHRLLVVDLLHAADLGRHRRAGQ